MFTHSRLLQLDVMEHVVDRLYEEMGRGTYVRSTARR